MATVLILANSDIGLYNFRKELIQKLLQTHQVYISLPDGNNISSLKKMGCNFIDTPVNRRGINPLDDLKLFLKYGRMLKKIKPDVVLSYTIKPNVYGGIGCRLRKIPFIPNITGLGSAIENESFIKKITLFLYRISLKRAECVFFQNNENKDFFVKNKIVSKNYKVIPGSGVNLNQFRILEYPSYDKKVNFLFIARIMKEKGIDEYLKAAEYIKGKYPNTVFHVLGFCEEDYERKLKEMQDKGVILYHGMQSDILEFHKISHCTIHPTYYPEGMSNVLLESAACGKPVITTNRAGCKEIVDPGVSGYIIEEKNSNDLIMKIEMFLELDSNSKMKMGLAGRQRVERDFDREIVIKEYVELIDKISGTAISK